MYRRVAPSHSPADGPIILISIDTLRADHLPAYGYTKVRTPNIDALAAAGTLFERAYSHAPQTLPAHTSILSGQLPFEHGVRDNVGFTVKPGQWFVQRGLQERGWPTGGFVSAYVLRAAVGLNQGFDTYDSELPPASGERSIGQVQRDGESTLAAAEKWLTARDPKKPFFLFFHIYEPHKPYAPPPRFASYEPYDGEIAYADEIVGRLFDRLRALEVYDRATIVLLADHGEGLGDHGEQEHGLFLYNATTQVPLIVKLPGQARARRVSTPVQHIDIVPTILDLAGAPTRAGLHGRSLRPLLEGTGTLPDTGIYSEALYSRYHFGWSELYGLTDARYRMIRAPRDELYDLERDPKESASIAGRASAGAAGDAHRARDADRARADRRAVRGDRRGSPAPGRARLRRRRQQRVALAAGGLARRSQGQGAGAREIPARHGSRGGPALRRGDHALSRGARRRSGNDRRLAAARRGLHAPGHAGGGGRGVQGDHQAQPEGRRQPDRRGGRAPASRQARRGAAACGAGGQRGAGGAHEILAKIALARRDRAAALREAKLAQEADPTLPMPLYVEGLLAYNAGRYEQALGPLLRAREALKGRTVQMNDLNYYIGDSLARLERYAQAEPYLVEEVRIFPHNMRARAGLAMLYRAMGRDLDSERAVEELLRVSPTPEGRAMAAQLWTMFGEPEKAQRVKIP